MENRTDDNDATSQNDPDRTDKVLHAAFVQHDLPPPMMISDGSLMVETAKGFTERSSGSDWHYDNKSAETEFGHIRILHGNGDMIYQDLTPDERSSILITLEDDRWRTDELTVSGGTVFRIISKKKLNNSPDHGHKRPKRCSHPGPGGTDFRIKRIEVKDSGGNTRFVASARDFEQGEFFSEEFRILIWLH